MPRRRGPGQRGRVFVPEEESGFPVADTEQGSSRERKRSACARVGSLICFVRDSDDY